MYVCAYMHVCVGMMCEQVGWSLVWMCGQIHNGNITKCHVSGCVVNGEIAIAVTLQDAMCPPYRM